MGKRRLGREFIIQALYQMEMTKSPIDTVLKDVLKKCKYEEIKTFIKDNLKGIASNLNYLDDLVEKQSKNWKINRLSKIDKNILRLALYEMFFSPDVPVNVCINEAIELGKKYSTIDSGSFINGILGSLVLEGNGVRHRNAT